MTGEQLEREFRGRGLNRGGILFLSAAVAQELVRRARDENIRVLGIDGFVLNDNSTQPSSAHSVDLSTAPTAGDDNPWRAAAEFLQQ